MTYAQKLKSPQWQKKRLLILENSGWKCQQCGIENKTLHIHHLYYKRDTNPWEYEDWSLICLCEDCHTIAQTEMEEAHVILAIHPHLIGAISRASNQLSPETVSVSLLKFCQSMTEICEESFALGKQFKDF